MASDTPFQVLIRREPGYEFRVSLRFEVESGLGILGLREPGRSEASPSPHGEETEVPGNIIQASRFIHIPRGSQRRNSYAFSRMSPELIERLPGSTWVELQPVTEYGFRYLTLPATSAISAQPAAVRVPAGRSSSPVAPVRSGTPPMARMHTPRTSSAPPSGPRLQRAPRASTPHQNTPRSQVPRQAPRQLAHEFQQAPDRRSPTPPPAPAHRPAPQGLPPKPMPMDPALGEAALRALSRDKAIAILRNEMAKTADLHRRLEDLGGKLAAAQARERDLLEVLRRWQERETPG